MPKHLWFGVVALLFGAGILAYTHIAAAGTVNYSMTLKKSSPGNCPVLVNDNPAPASVHVKQGDTVNLTLTSEMHYPMSTPEVWISSQYSAHAGTAYSPVTTFAYTGSDSQHTGSSPWTASVGNVQQDLVIVTSFGIGETCLDGPSTELSYVRVDQPEQQGAQSPQPTKKKPQSSTNPTAVPTQTTAAQDAPASATLGGVTVKDKKVDTSKSVEINQSDPLVLSGTTIPNGTVTLTIHSTPRTVSVQADERGDWSYAVKDLEPGDHYIEASVKDPTTGKESETTRLLSFKVAEASTTMAEKVQDKDSPTRLLVIILGSTALLLAVLVLIFRHKLHFHLKLRR